MNNLIKETYYGDLCVGYYHNQKVISTMHKGYRVKRIYSLDFTTKSALKHFKTTL